jgi:hypothetical protein
MHKNGLHIQAAALKGLSERKSNRAKALTWIFQELEAFIGKAFKGAAALGLFKVWRL